uniref:CRISPR-associated helicase Cas3' n=1 Tax=Marinobacterium profundum TaxID=1714300 RepID=UPI000830CD32|nr:CRISPR-associated helicase Cas3' [Marinobacterium profundum]
MIRRRNTTITRTVLLVDAIPFGDCPAKSYQGEDGRTYPGRSVFNHCQIVGEVAREIIRRSPCGIAQALFPEGAPFAAANHDIGKVSPTFYNKITRACAGELIPGFSPDLEKGWGGHAGVSQLTARAMGAPDFVPEIMGQHHGFSPPVAGKRAADEIFGGAAWQNEREELVQALQEYFGETWPHVESAPQARLLAGLTSVADWIGSGELFEDPLAPWEENIGKALDAAGFVPPTYKTRLSFEQVFGFSPRDAQSSLIEQVASPGVYVLEAPMGLGKTEAALYAAYRVLSSSQASGIYFALPTQLTSNKIFERFNQFLQGDDEKGLSGILADDCRHRSLLLHGNAWMLDTDMGEEGRPGGAWFNQAKRGLLAPFAVGTIDQALMAAMNVKHGFVRAFGLAGKVVILDEVHTYDAYTGTLLDALVALLRSLHCTVIILSATLNRDRRQQLLADTLSASDYPLITACPALAEVREVPVPAGPSCSFTIRLQRDEKLAVEQALLRAEQGQQVLWIENTVLEAQQRYLDLAARASELGVACGLLHSRFTADDRQNMEDKWVNLFGKAGWPQRGEQGRILVGTQVLEQSLDIDADFMVTRFAPTDMLLQRLGRLWRHEDTLRCKMAGREAWLLAPELEAAIDEPEKHFGSSAFVYSPYVLCRSLEVWQTVQTVKLPEDIRGLIESTYATRLEQGQMNRWSLELVEGTPGRNGKLKRAGRKTLRQLARVTLADAGNTLPESKAQTRYSEADNFEVLLLRNLRLVPEKELTLLTLLSGEQLHLPWKRHHRDKAQWRQLSAALMRQVVAVRVQDAPKALPVDKLKRFGLQHCFYLGSPDWPNDESVLRVALVDDTGSLQGVEYAEVHEKYTLEYRNDLGYRVIKD